MAVIRNDDARALMRDAVVLDLGDLQRQAARLRARAEAEAEAILHEARARAQKIIDGATNRGFQEGREKGYADGLEAGQAAGTEQALQEARISLESLRSAWAEALTAFLSAREEIIHESSNDALRFAIALAERIVYRVVEVDDTVVQDQVRASIQFVAGASTLRIRVNPQDATLVAQVMPEVEAILARDAHVRLEADVTIEPGGCVLQTQRGGEIDARIGTQIERIIEHLLPNNMHAVQSHAEASPHDPNTPHETAE